jgi:dUTP pyrophosphatase
MSKWKFEWTPLEVNFKKLHLDAVTPSYAKEGDVGLDLTVVSIEDKNEFIQYNFGIAIEIPDHYFGMMVPRSSITKMNVMMKNSVGIIDSGYRGELVMRCKKVKFEDGTQIRSYQKGDKAAQLIILPYPKVLLQEALELAESERGTNGFGSTGK